MPSDPEASEAAVRAWVQRHVLDTWDPAHAWTPEARAAFVTTTTRALLGYHTCERSVAPPQET